MQSNNHLEQWLYKRGISQEVLRLFDVDTDYDHPTIGKSIRIPFSKDHAKYRRDPLDERKPKYLYDAGGKVTLYGADKLLGSETKNIVITEGELDTLVLWSANIPAVSSTGGALSFQEEWAIALAPCQVYVCFDNDSAGAEGMVKVLSYIPDAKVIFIPKMAGVKDVSDYVAKGGDFHELMATARSYSSVGEVEEEMKKRQATWQDVTFHNKYLDKHREKEHRANKPVPTSDKSDEVLRAKDYPMENLLEFRGSKMCCPWHNETGPSLHFYPKNNNAYCWGECGKAYDSIDAYMFVHKVGFLEAVKELNKLV